MTIEFESAVAALYSSEHQARSKQAIQNAAMRRTRTIQDMREYLRRANVDLSPSIGIVHVTGTKGKGSTACLCESILRGRNNYKTGLFTSPHLVDIRERIRIGGLPVSKAVFGQAYWNVRRKLEGHVREEDDELPILPGYFRMLVLLAIYIFANYQPCLDVIVLEVGMGGRYDATNIFDMDTRNVVCGVTLLDLDHTRVLGDTLEKIAWEKGGIFQVKKGCDQTISSSPQGNPLKTTENLQAGTRRFFAIGTNTPSSLKVLLECAVRDGQDGQLCVVNEHDGLDGVEIGLPGSHQRINAALATTLCNSLTNTITRISDDELLHQSLRNAAWPGRCQTVNTSNTNVTLRLDGAHTPISLQVCLSWYLHVHESSSQRVLIFNCHHERNPVPLLQQLHDADFHFVHFCPADFERPSALGKPSASTLLEEAGFESGGNLSRQKESATWQDTLSEIWRHLDTLNGRFTTITANASVRETLNSIIAVDGGPAKDVLVAGSLYLVGSALSTVDWVENDAVGSLRM
jgi:folylpolyglutamate synthase